MTEKDPIEKFKVAGFSVLLCVVSYFGVKVLEKVDKINDTLIEVNVNVQKLNVSQGYNDRQLEDHDDRIKNLERDHTEVNLRSHVGN
jgi:hypothetical protein